MHAPDMLREQVFAVEVVGFLADFVALIAAPVAEAKMLRVGVTLPFVLGGETGRAAVRRQWTGEGAVRCAYRSVLRGLSGNSRAEHCSCVAWSPDRPCRSIGVDRTTSSCLASSDDWRSWFHTSDIWLSVLDERRSGHVGELIL